MISVCIRITDGREVRFTCDPEDPVLDRLARVLSPQPGSAGSPLFVDFDDNGRRRGVEIPLDAIAAIETEPPIPPIRRSSEPVVERTPYVLIPDFLSPEENRRILDYAISKEGEFEASTVVTGEPGFRQSRVLRPIGDMPVDTGARMSEIAAEVLTHLSLPPLPEFTLRQSMVASNDGDYYKIHRDNSSPMNFARVMSSLYYFHRDPRGFGGGGLRLYDTRIVDGERWWADSYDHVRPDNNTIVFFPSGAYHEVLPVDCQSRAFADSRFTVNTNFYDAARVASDAE